MGGINHQKWVVYYCCTHIMFRIEALQDVFQTPRCRIPLLHQQTQRPGLSIRKQDFQAAAVTGDLQIPLAGAEACARDVEGAHATC